jgi:hypothetical protein
VAGAFVLSGLILYMGGNREPQQAKRKDAHGNPKAASKAKTSRHRPGKKTVAARAAAAKLREAREQKALEQLTKFEGLAPEDKAGRLKRVEAFMAKYRGSAAASRAGRLAKVLKSALAPRIPTKPKEPASAKAFAVLTAFKDLKENDLAGRMTRIDGFLKAHPGTPEARKAANLLSKLKAQLKTAMAEQAASPGTQPATGTDVAQASPEKGEPKRLPPDTKAQPKKTTPTRQPADAPSTVNRKTDPTNASKPKPRTFVADAKAPPDFNEAARFEFEGKADHRAVALRWMGVAEALKRNAYARKAASRAREAARRHEAAYGGADESPEESEAVKLLREAQTLEAADDMEGAIKAYKNSLRRSETIVGRRKLGLAMFKHAEDTKGKWETEFEKAKEEYETALRSASRSVRGRGGRTRTFVNHRDPALITAKSEMSRLYNQVNKIFARYAEARTEFKRVLDLMPGNLDLEAEAHVAFSYTVKGDVMSRSRGRKLLDSVLAKYKPFDDREKAVYERCKRELQRVSKK